MARHRSYRNDLRCPHCGSNRMPNEGRSGGKQTLSLRRLQLPMRPGRQPPLLSGENHPAGARLPQGKASAYPPSPAPWA